MSSTTGHCKSLPPSQHFPSKETRSWPVFRSLLAGGPRTSRGTEQGVDSVCQAPTMSLLWEANTSHKILISVVCPFLRPSQPPIMPVYLVVTCKWGAEDAKLRLKTASSSANGHQQTRHPGETASGRVQPWGEPSVTRARKYNRSIRVALCHVLEAYRVYCARSNWIWPTAGFPPQLRLTPFFSLQTNDCMIGRGYPKAALSETYIDRSSLRINLTSLTLQSGSLGQDRRLPTSTPSQLTFEGLLQGF